MAVMAEAFHQKIPKVLAFPLIQYIAARWDLRCSRTEDGKALAMMGRVAMGQSWHYLSRKLVISMMAAEWDSHHPDGPNRDTVQWSWNV